MNDFYPIYKMKLKPWIKYWLIKKLNGSGKSTLKVVTISSGTLKKVDKSKSLSIKEYFGNTVQNGTPSPQVPVDIQTISGDNTFTINSNSYRVDLGGKNLVSLDTVQYNLTNQYYKDYSMGIKITENMVGKIYSLSYKIQVSNYSGTPTSFFSVIGRSTNNTGMQHQIKEINNTLNTTEIMNCKIETITIPNNVGEFLILRFSGFGSQVTGTFNVSNIQLEKRKYSN